MPSPPPSETAGPSGRERDNGPSGRERDSSPSGQERDNSARCSGCGEVMGQCPTDGRCTGAYEPPRFCTTCGRRLAVRVKPTGWSARCRDHGAVTS